MGSESEPERAEVGINGVVRFSPDAHGDARGSMMEIFRRSWLGAGFEALQANLSESRAGVLRGLHLHGQQTDYWCVLAGTAFIGLVDLRPGSPTFRRSAELRVAANDDRAGLLIPPGVAHGFYAETAVLLLYLVDRYYGGPGADELGLAWDDPSVGIGWPSKEPILSERDRSNPRLEELIAVLGID
jgi:dTDP-4-dehydrorhamnose 3,5-epimerase